MARIKIAEDVAVEPGDRRGAVEDRAACIGMLDAVDQVAERRHPAGVTAALRPQITHALGLRRLQRAIASAIGCAISAESSPSTCSRPSAA